MRMSTPNRTFRLLLFSISLLAVGSATTLLGGEIVLKEGWRIQSGTDVTVGGSEISSVSFNPERWYPTKFPTTVLAALVANSVYPDPYYGTNLATIPGYRAQSWQTQDMPEGSPFDCPWWYRTEFHVPVADKGKKIWLHFDGINYRATIWINGQQTVDYTEPDESIEQTGLIGLQIHGGPPTEAWYKEVRIRELGEE